MDVMTKSTRTSNALTMAAGLLYFTSGVAAAAAVAKDHTIQCKDEARDYAGNRDFVQQQCERREAALDITAPAGRPGMSLPQERPRKPKPSQRPASSFRLSA
jgi:hypothetical protein